MEGPSTYLHPKSGKPVYGIKLKAGDKIQEGDLFDSCDGEWTEIHFDQIRVPETGVLNWIHLPEPPAGAD